VPVIDVTGSLHAVNGGSTQVDVTGQSNYDQVAVYMVGVLDYYLLSVPSGTSTSMLVYVPQNVRVSTLNASFMASSNNVFGPSATHAVNIIRVGTGDIQVSLTFDKPSDIDLHVVDPNGEEIYYGNRTSASGVRLDLDSNAACNIDGRNNENITWPAGRGISGTYTVRVDNWDSCGAEPIDWAVTVHSGD